MHGQPDVAAGSQGNGDSATEKPCSWACSHPWNSQPGEDKNNLLSQTGKNSNKADFRQGNIKNGRPATAAMFSKFDTSIHTMLQRELEDFSLVDKSHIQAIQIK